MKSIESQLQIDNFSIEKFDLILVDSKFLRMFLLDSNFKKYSILWNVFVKSKSQGQSWDGFLDLDLLERFYLGSNVFELS